MPLHHRSKRDAYAVYLLISGAGSLCFSLVFTVNLFYHVTKVELNPLQLVLVGTLLEGSVFLFEVPTGVVADVYSRRLSVIIGYALIGLGFALEGSVPRFEAVLLAQVLWGVGYTFTSGAEQAWIADEVGEDKAGDAFLRASQIGRIGGLAGIPLSVGLASAHVTLPIVLGGALFVGLALVLALVMPENGFTPTPPAERESWHTLARTFTDGVRLVRGRAMLVTFLGVSVFYGLYSEALDRLWTRHLLDIGLPGLGPLEPVAWFGIIGALALLLSLGTTELVKRRLDTTDRIAILRTLQWLSAGTVLAIFAFALAGRFGVALAALLAFQVVRSTSGPLFMAWINPHVESRVRATVFSMASQVDAISQVAGGPVLGFIGKTWSVRAALAASGLVLSPVLLLYTRALRRERTADAPLAAPVSLDS